MQNNNTVQLINEKAAKLFELIEQRKQIEKLEKQLKSEFKAIATTGAMTFGSYTILLSEQTRTGVNKKKLIAELGDISRFETSTTYQKLDIKKNA